ncbi:MAG: hypothetical protein SF339_27355 [Blastocatellia bacterium]|nr:hypothetical protein [Blastocatellia bacterium]
MKTQSLLLLTALLGICLLAGQDGANRKTVSTPTSQAAAAGDADFLVETTTRVKDVKRLGANLGLWTYWGAEQLMSNVLKNPGFEGLIDRAVVIVSRADRQGFSDDTTWLGRADGFWTGAEFEVRTGLSAGVRGRIGGSRKAGANGLPEFTTVGEAPQLVPGDVISLTRETESELPTQWWYPPESTSYVMPERNDRRPNSAGRRSLAIKPPADRAVEIISFLDTIGERAGKLLPVRGAWRLSFWSRACAGRPSINVEFRRAGSPAFLNRTIAPTDGWTKTTLDFTADDRGPAGTLELHVRASGANACVLLDDVELGAVQNDGFPFRAEVVQALQQLRPGYLRDWQGQMGDTLANRLAPAFGRRASRYRPDNDGTDFGYSLPEFLDLCTKLDSLPWIVVPPTFTDEELQGLGRYLNTQSRFAEIVVEFGNENWNSTFRPAGIPDPIAHGAAATRAFEKIRAGAGPHLPLRMTINGQHTNAEYTGRFAQFAPTADLMALGPYFQYSLMAGATSAQWLNDLFASTTSNQLMDEARQLGPLGKELAIYEINLHTTEGNASAAERDPLTTGAASGSAVARVMLDSLGLGVRRQCIYTFSGYDAWLSNYSGFVKLWGIVRDVGETERFRPTGLALSMINQVIAGDLMQSANQSGVQAEIYPFRSKGAWSAAVVSTSSVDRVITVRFPPGAHAPGSLRRLDAPMPWASNETATNVRIVKEMLTPEGNQVTFRLPAYGLVTLLSKEKKNGN